MNTNEHAPSANEPAQSWTLWLFQVDGPSVREAAYLAMVDSGLGATAFDVDSTPCLAINTDDVTGERLLQQVLSQVTPTARLRHAYRPPVAA